MFTGGGFGIAVALPQLPAAPWTVNTYVSPTTMPLPPCKTRHAEVSIVTRPCREANTYEDTSIYDEWQYACAVAQAERSGYFSHVGCTTPGIEVAWRRIRKDQLLAGILQGVKHLHWSCASGWKQRAKLDSGTACGRTTASRMWHYAGREVCMMSRKYKAH